MKKHIILALLAVATGFISNDAQASFSGATFTLDNPYSLYVASSSVTISNVAAAAYSTGTLVVSNAAASPITVSWTAPGRAMGLGTTNLISLPAGQLAQIDVNTAVSGMTIYKTEVEQAPSSVTGVPVAPPSLIPDLLYYKMTEGTKSYLYNYGYYESSPVYLTDSSTHGGTTGTITATAVPIQWVTNQNSTLESAVHFNGASTVLDSGASSLFNFTTNLFTINIWVRNLTYPCAICGNGLYQNSGWYVVINPAGEVVVAAESPGSDSYVATTSTVAFAGQWCMITVVRTGINTALIYCNGVQQNTIGSFANPASCNNNMIFGDNYYGNQYDGDLGIIRIYGRPLSATEINTIYRQETTP